MNASGASVTAHGARPGGDAGWRWQGRLAAVRIALLGAYSCAVVALAVSGLAHGARTGEWRQLWATLYGAIFTLFLPLLVWLRFGYLGVHTRKAAQQRAAQLPADAALLPLATEQSTPLTPDELAELPRGFAAVRFVGSGAVLVWNDVLNTANIVVMGGMLLSLTYVAGYASMSNLSNASIGPVPVVLLWVGGMLLFYLPLAFLPTVSGYLGHDAVRWGADGLRYRRWPLAQHDTLLPWSRIQAVVRANYRSAWEPGVRRTYAMHATEGVFAWGLSSTYRHGDEELLRLIVAKTGLPVRELLPEDAIRELPVSRIPLRGAHRRVQMVAAATLERVPPEAAERLRATLPTEREERRGRILTRLAFAPALLLMTLYLVGAAMQVFGR